MSAVLLGAAALAAWALTKKQGDDVTGDELSPDTLSQSLVGASKADLEAAALDAANKYAAPGDVFLAIIDTENPPWNTQATNTGPGDYQRGDALGLPQITYLTAIDVDRTANTAWNDIAQADDPTNPDRPQWILLSHPEIALELGAAYIAQLAQRARSMQGDFESNVASLYNSNKPLASAPLSTRNTYVPRFLRNLAARRGGNNA